MTFEIPFGLVTFLLARLKICSVVLVLRISSITLIPLAHHAFLPNVGKERLCYKRLHDKPIGG